MSEGSAKAAAQPYHGPANRAEDNSIWWRAARMKAKYSPLLMLLAAGALVLGFQWLSPNERITKLEREVAAMRQDFRYIRDAKCVELTPSEVALIQLNCTEIYDRMSQQELITRGRPRPDTTR